MKTPSNHLFDLIKSLDKSEKRYFRIFSTKEVNNDSTLFIKLYDLIEKQADSIDTYNEEEIKKQLAGSKLIKQFPFYKNYLYNILLQSLRHYHAGTSTDAFLKNKIQEITILYDKGLFVQCDGLIKDTKKLALKYDKKLIILELLEWEALVKNALADTKGLAEYITVGNAEQVELLNLYHSHVKLTKFMYEVSNDAHMHTGSNIPHFIKLEKVDEAFAPIAKSKRINFMSTFFYNLTKSSFYLFSNKPEKDYEYRKKIYELLEENKHITIELPHFTFFSIFNYALSCSFVKKYDEAIDIIHMLRKKPNNFFKKRSKYLEANIFSYTYSLEMQLVVTRETYSDSTEMETIIRSGLKEHGYIINDANKLVLYSLLAIILFADQKYKQALNWINDIINYEDDKLRVDIHCNARIMNTLIHYELGNYDYLKNLYRSTTRYLKKNNHFNQLEKKLLDFVTTDLPFTEKENKFEVIRKFKEQLLPLMDNKNAMQILYYRNINVWLKNNSI